jgi:hypothetical protein
VMSKLVLAQFFFCLLTCMYTTHFFLLGLGFELRPLCLQSRHSLASATPAVHFALVIFRRWGLRTICLGWPQTLILPISASQVARIIGMSHWCLTYTTPFKEKKIEM